MSNEQMNETPATPDVSASDHPAAVTPDTLTPPLGASSGDEAVPMPGPGSISIEVDDAALRNPALPYPLVAIGASAGGLQAFCNILDKLSPETGMTFVLVLHLAADQDSQMVSVLQPHTTMPVAPISEGEQPLPNHVYVLPPNHTVRLDGGRFRLEERGPSKGIYAPVNVFFRSVAEDQRNLSVGVVLSGADFDGAEGLKTIKGEGGLALVQSPESSMQPGMPRNSIAADHVDMVLAPAELAEELGRIAIQFARPALLILERGQTPEGEDEAFLRILQMLRSKSGLELRMYKPETIRRRLARRMVLQRMESLSEYQAFLQKNPEEVRGLQEDILINVTRFFRDPEFWEAFQAQVLPALFKDRPVDKPVRIWCAGCSSGEEAYSLAVSVLEYITNNRLDTPVQVFGTDASERSIDKARAAVYPETVANDITPDRLRRYFLKTDGTYQVSKRVRDLCIFARQNLCNDPPFSHMDIVSCRNVMIYFNATLQRQIMSTFHYALDPGGYMLLGMSEGLRDYRDAFAPVDRKHKLYTKLGGRLSLNFPVSRDYRSSRANPAGRTALIDAGEFWPEADLQRAADRIVLARFGPPALVIDEQMNVVQSRGQTSPLIQLSPGTVSWNLARVLRADILSSVQQVVQRAIDEDISTSVTLETYGPDQKLQQYQVDVLPIATSGVRSRCFLILFQTAEAGVGANTPLRLVLPVSEPSGDEKDRLVVQLRNDLNGTRFHLQTLVEERDTRNQELVSANEEIQSANEELQSTNEELETTKEELQSTNEELQTVNDELQQRNQALEQTGNDLRNLLTSVNIPLLMLTSDLHIRQFTPPMQKLLSVLPSDIGRPIGNIRMQLSVEDIEPLLKHVLETLSTHESEVQDREGKWHLLRIRPYRTSDNKIEGLVMVLVDIDQLRSSQQMLIEARDFSLSVVESVPVPVVVLSRDCTIRTVNSAFRELVQMRTSELTGRSFPDLAQLLWGFSVVGHRLQELGEAEAGAGFTVEYDSPTPERRILLMRGLALATEGDRVMLLVMEDITLRRRAEQTMSTQNEVLEGEVKSAALELDRTQQELRGLTAHLFTAQEEERQRVARELHDDIGQRLSLLALVVESVGGSKLDAAATSKLDEARKQVEALSTDVRNISHQLHPAIMDDLGLSAALKALVDEFGKREDMPATYVARNLPDLPSQPATTAVYRITQEALRNVAKHAGRTHVKVLLEVKANRLHLEVRDLGIGFDLDRDGGDVQNGLGMITMTERARLAHGTLSVTSALGEGTTVVADVPLEQHA